MEATQTAPPVLEDSRIDELEARLAALEKKENGHRPVFFDDLMSNAYPQLVLVHKSVLAEHEAQLRALLDERGTLVARLRDLRRQHETAVARANGLLRVIQGEGKGFGVVVPSGEQQATEAEIRAEIRVARAESEKLAREIREAKERLKQLMNELRTQWLPLPVGRFPIQTDGSGEG